MADEPIPIEIRAKGTSAADADDLELTVHCPLRDHALPLTECFACEHCDGLRVNGTEQSALVCCRAPHATDRTRSGSYPPAGLGAEAERTPVADIMTRDVICVSSDLDVEALTVLFLDKGISGAPVVDSEGRPVGIVSKTDVLRELARRGHTIRDGTATVADIMMPIAFALPQNQTIARAAAVMAFEGVHRLPVLAPDGTVSGVVSSLDVLRWLAKGEGYVVR